MPPLQKKAQNFSATFTSRNALLDVPKVAHDTLFFSATSQELCDLELTGVENHENMKGVFETGRHNCKYLAHPGKKVPLLTKASTRTFSTFDEKPPRDLELNQASYKFQLAQAGGKSMPQVSSTYGSRYLEEYGREVSDERRRDAKPSMLRPSTAEWKGEQMVLASHTQTIHVGQRKMPRTTPWMPKNGIEQMERSPDFWRTRQQVAHSASAIGVAPPLAMQPTRASRRRRGDHATVETFLEDMKQSLHRSPSAPARTVPISHLGSVAH